MTVVQVYRNVHQSKKAGRPIYSIRDKKTRKVIDHAGTVILTDATCRVSESGRQRVLQEKRKNVHAWIEGTLVEEAELPASDPVEITYSPYLYGSFVESDTCEPVRHAGVVMLHRKVLVWNAVA